MTFLPVLRRRREVGVQDLGELRDLGIGVGLEVDATPSTRTPLDRAA